MAKENNQKIATMADIARASGVSVATVSLVLRNKPGVSQRTRQRVFDTATALGYLHNESAQSENRRLPKTIGLFVKTTPLDQPATNNFYAPVLSGIETICRRKGINLIFSNLLVDEVNRPVETPKSLLENEFEGLLMVGMHLNSSLVSLIEELRIPAVLVDSYADENIFDAVISDNYSGAYKATKYLIERGHQHIAIIGSQPDAFPSILERRSGYTAALKEHDLTPYYMDSPLRPESIPVIAEQLVVKHPQVSAVFACNDETAISLMRTLQNMGKKVPQDVSIIGFDNIGLTQFVNPALTTMQIDMVGMGRFAVNLLLDRYEYPEANRIRTIICPKMVFRKSVK